MKTVYDYALTDLQGNAFDLNQFKGKKILLGIRLLPVDLLHNMRNCKSCMKIIKRN